MAKRVVNLNLDERVLARVDAEAGPRGRSKWFEALAIRELCRSTDRPGRVESIRAMRAGGLAPQPAKMEQPVARKSAKAPPKLVRGSSLVTDDLADEWGQIMAARQQRLNRQIDGSRGDAA